MRERIWKISIGILLTLQVWRTPLPCSAQEDLGLYARSAVLMDGDSGRILYAKEDGTELPMASTTKIMTCIVALEEAEEDTVCTASSNAAAQPPVKLGMTKGDQFYLRDLLRSLMLESHNDAAVCIAETVGGSVEGFAEKMNAKAREIGCAQTHYVTPNGLDAQDGGGGHRTTAGELALVMRYCLTQSPKREEFLEVTRTGSCTFTDVSGRKSYGCTNHNAFLQIMDGALSGKTGFTGKAGYCYVGALRRDEKLLIVALLACGWPSHKGYKWVDTKKLMNYGLEHFEKKEIIRTDLQPQPVAVLDGQSGTVHTAARQIQGLQILMRPEEQAEVRIEQLSALNAPVAQGEQVGRISYLVDGQEYASCPIVTTEAVKIRDYRFCLEQVLEMFFQGGS